MKIVSTAVDVKLHTSLKNVFGKCIYFCRLVILGLSIFLSSCIANVSIQNLDASSPEISNSETKISSPSSIVLNSPTLSPGPSSTPSFLISGVVSGHRVEIFSDSACTILLGSQIANGSTVTITSSSLPSGSHTIFAKSIDELEKSSECSTANANYIFQPRQLSFTSATLNVDEATALRGANAWATSLPQWTKRIKLNINNSGQATNLSDFPVLVTLNSTRVNYLDFKAMGSDLRFTDSSGNLLSYEIESWNTSGNSYVWVKVPSITASSNSDFINMYYGNSAALSAQNPNDVWSNGYAAVWHFNGSLNDSTSNGNNGSGTNTAFAAGNFSDALSFNGTNSLANFGNNPSLQIASAVTMETWIKPNVINVDQKIGGNGIFPSGFLSGYKLSIAQGGNGKVTFEISGNGYADDVYWISPIACTIADCSTYTGGGVATGGTSLTANTWAYISGTYSQASNKITTFVNGTLDRQKTTTITLMPATGVPFELGRENGGLGVNNHHLNGLLDELRVSNVARSADWIKATYLSQTDTFLSYSKVQNITNGQATITVQLDQATSSDTLVPLSFSGTATLGVDYGIGASSILIPGGQTTATASLNIFWDSNIEPNETIVATLSAPTDMILGLPSTNTITIIDFLNVAPVATNDSAIILPDTVSNSISVLSNDSDANTADTLAVNSITQGLYGTVTKNETAVFYTPNSFFSGVDTFTYTVVDESGVVSNSATVTVSVRSPFNWTGGGGNSDFATAGNWFGGIAPSTNDIAYFADTFCSTNCNVNISASIVNLKGMYLGPLYSGIISQGSGRSITIGTNGYYQYAGTFLGSDAAIVLNGHFRLLGGTFTMPSSTLTVNRADYLVSGSPTLNTLNSTLRFTNTAMSSANSQSITPGAFTYNNVSFEGWASAYNLNSSTWTISGDLVLGDTYTNPSGYYNSINSGTILLSGDLVLTNYSNIGSAVIQLTGNPTGQTVSSVSLGAGALGANLTVAAGANTVNFSGTIPLKNLTVTSGVVDFGTATINPSGGFTYSGGTINMNSSTFKFTCISGQSGCWGSTVTLNVGSLAFNDLYINGGATAFNLVGSTPTVNGNLYIGDIFTGAASYAFLNTGTISVKGNVSIQHYGMYGTGVIKLIGNSSQTITSTTSVPIPNLTIVSTGGTVSFVGPVKVNGATVATSGTIVLGGASDSFTTSTLNLGGLVFTKNGGTLTVGGTVAGTGSLFSGTVDP